MRKKGLGDLSKLTKLCLNFNMLLYFLKTLKNTQASVVQKVYILQAETQLTHVTVPVHQS